MCPILEQCEAEKREPTGNELLVERTTRDTQHAMQHATRRASCGFRAPKREPRVLCVPCANLMHHESCTAAALGASWPDLPRRLSAVHVQALIRLGVAAKMSQLEVDAHERIAGRPHPYQDSL